MQMRACVATMSRRSGKQFQKAKHIDSLFRVVIFDDMTYDVSDSRMTSSLETKLQRHASYPVSTYIPRRASEKAGVAIKTYDVPTRAQTLTSPEVAKLEYKVQQQQNDVNFQENDVSFQKSDHDFHEALGACLDSHRPKQLCKANNDSTCTKSGNEVRSGGMTSHALSSSGEKRRGLEQRTNIKTKAREKHEKKQNLRRLEPSKVVLAAHDDTT